MPVADTVSSNGQRDTATGLIILAMGWLGPLVGQFAWFANLLLPIALWVAAKSRSGARRFGLILAVLLGLLAASAMFWSSVPMDNGENVIVRYRPGYWLWIAAVIGGALWVGIIAAKERAAERLSTS